MFQPGDTFSKFVLVRKLGEGGMGLVYEAKNSFGVPVVLKMLHPDLAVHADLRERFRREGRIQNTLRHPHIVRVTDIVEDRGVPALVVDYMRGKDLDQVLRAGVKLTQAQIRNISVKILDALQTAHEKGFIHRDIKPSNIFLEQVEGGFEPRLMDFGIAKIEEAAALTRAQEFCGTPNFASPEQIQSTRDVDARADVYSFGMVLWQLAAGREPYAEIGDPYEIMAAVVRKPVPTLPADALPWLRHVVEKATQKDPDARYQTAAEMRDAVADAGSARKARDTVLTLNEGDLEPVPPSATPSSPKGGATVAKQTGEELARIAFAPPTPEQVEARKQAEERRKGESGAGASSASPAGAMPDDLSSDLSGDLSGVPGFDPASAAPAAAGTSPKGPAPTQLPGNSPQVASDGSIMPPGGPPPATMLAASGSVSSDGTVTPPPPRGAPRPAPPASSPVITPARPRTVPPVAAASEGGLLAKLRIWLAVAAFIAIAAAVLYPKLQTTSSLPAGWVRIEPGSFTRGSPESEPGRADLERQHQVTITRPFAIQANEVTQDEWKALTYRDTNGFAACGARCPVTMVSWFDAVEYANRLSERESLERCYEVVEAGGTKRVTWLKGLDCKGYRLPTEAEWEYAARAGGGEAFGRSGITETDYAPLDKALSELGWYGGNSQVTYANGVDCSKWVAGHKTCGIQPVGKKLPNAWGLRDMSGNVAEWVWDTLAPYPTGSVTDPVNHVAGQMNILRGGSWNSTARDCRLAARERAQPVGRFNNGIRLVRTLE
jgi:serine/threonine-protein kinase